MSDAEIVRKSIQTIWTAGAVDRVPDFYSEEFVCHPGPGAGIAWPNGRAGVREIVTATRLAFPDYREEPHLVVAEGGLVAVRQVVTGTNTGPLTEHFLVPLTGRASITHLEPTGRSIEVLDMMVCRVADGLLVEQWGLLDLHSIARQLDLDNHIDQSRKSGLRSLRP